jgi:hypothetical protein
MFTIFCVPSKLFESNRLTDYVVTMINFTIGLVALEFGQQLRYIALLDLYNHARIRTNQLYYDNVQQTLACV